MALGQDHIEDAYYPWGRHNMPEVAFLAGHVLGFRTDERQRLLVEMVTMRAPAALGLVGHGLAVGDVADFCVHGHERVVNLLREREAPRAVYRADAWWSGPSPPSDVWRSVGPARLGAAGVRSKGACDVRPLI